MNTAEGFVSNDGVTVVVRGRVSHTVATTVAHLEAFDCQPSGFYKAPHMEYIIVNFLSFHWNCTNLWF